MALRSNPRTTSEHLRTCSVSVGARYSFAMKRTAI
jgi:hypothetical protein